MSSQPFEQPASLGDRLDDLLLRAEARVARGRVVVVAGAVIAVAASLAWWSLATSQAEAPIEDSIPLASTVPVASDGQPVTPAEVPVELAAPGQGRRSGPDSEADRAEVVVHVVGAIRSPGLVTLAPGDRVSDAVAAAGGGLPEADLARLNLASPVIDGMQIRVPPIDEGATDAPPLVQLPAVAGGSGAGQGQAVAGPIDLNAADEAGLQTLPGIGPALAARIVAWRAENGGFAAVDDLEAVPGIGPATLARLRDLVTV